MDLQNELNPNEQTHQSQLDLAHWAGNWIWRAVQCLVESSDFDPSPKWAAQRLNVSVDKIVEAFDGLERLKIIERKGKTFSVNSNWYQVTKDQATPSQLLEAHAKLSPQMISKLKSDDKYSAQFFLGNRDLLAKYSHKFMALYKEMNDEGRSLGLKEVVASQISFTVLTSNESGGLQ